MANQTTAPGGAPDLRDERRTTAWVGSALRIEGKIISRESLTIDGERLPGARPWCSRVRTISRSSSKTIAWPGREQCSTSSGG